jgi:hypothetical protein
VLLQSNKLVPFHPQNVTSFFLNIIMNYRFKILDGFESFIILISYYSSHCPILLEVGSESFWCDSSSLGQLPHCLACQNVPNISCRGFNLHFLITNEVENLSTCLLISSYWNACFKTFGHFFGTVHSSRIDLQGALYLS